MIGTQDYNILRERAHLDIVALKRLQASGNPHMVEGYNKFGEFTSIYVSLFGNFYINDNPQPVNDAFYAAKIAGL